jgi:hypothetical protein
VLHVVGNNPSPDVVELANDTVEVHGCVADLEPLHQRCRLSVAPLRYEAGIKGKVGESASTSDPSVGHRRRLEELRERPELTERQPACRQPRDNPAAA